MARNTRSLRKVLHVQCAVLEILSSEDLNPKNFNKNFLMIDVMIAHKYYHNHRLLSIYGIGNGITCAIVPHSNAPEILPRILSARKELVKGHLSRTFD